MNVPCLDIINSLSTVIGDACYTGCCTNIYLAGADATGVFTCGKPDLFSLSKCNTVDATADLHRVSI